MNLPVRTDQGRVVLRNSQYAPYPTVLAKLVDGLVHKPDWSFELRQAYERGQDCVGLTLMVTVTVPDSYDPTRTKVIQHPFAVPPAAYDMRSWRRWLFDRLGDVDTHERGEFFTIDGEKPYAPSHGPGNDPYLIREVGTDVDVRTSYRGVLDA